MAGAVWIGLVIAVGVFAWGCMPNTFGGRRDEGKAFPLDRTHARKGEDDAARL